MKFSRPTIILLATVVVVCAVAAMTEAARGSWRDNYAKLGQIRELMRGGRTAVRSQGPVGGIIDIIIDIILILLSIIFGGQELAANADLLREQVDQIKVTLDIN